MWVKVAVGGSVAMTVYRWHMTALVGAVALTHPPLDASAPIDPAPAADPRGDR